MRGLVNALSVTNPSGAHVLLGHLEGLLDLLGDRLHWTVLCRADEAGLKRRLGSRVDWADAPESTRHWFHRAVWEARELSRVVDQCKADVYFTPSGIAARSLAIPQVVFCQNPWAMVPDALRMSDHPKAWLQRRAYRQTMRSADVMIFNSRFMQEAYRRNAGCNEREGHIVYQAPDDETHRRAAEWHDVPRRPGQILCVSVMGPHKNAETLLQALHRVRAQGHTEASLHIVGSWPDAAYERRIQRLIRTLDLDTVVHVAGFVARETLDRYYAESHLFTLMSRCESFGIPAVEAQLFGTPVVSSNVCAIPEIVGKGGLCINPDDVEGVAAAWHQCLSDPARWQKYSQAARENSARFKWSEVTKPLADIFIKRFHLA